MYFCTISINMNCDFFTLKTFFLISQMKKLIISRIRIYMYTTTWYNWQLCILLYSSVWPWLRSCLASTSGHLMFYFILELNRTVNAWLLKVETNFIGINCIYLMFWNGITFVKLKCVDKSIIQCIILIIRLLKIDHYM